MNSITKDKTSACVTRSHIIYTLTCTNLDLGSGQLMIDTQNPLTAGT